METPDCAPTQRAPDARERFQHPIENAESRLRFRHDRLHTAPAPQYLLQRLRSVEPGSIG